MKKLLMTKLPLLLGLLLAANAWLHAQELRIHQLDVGQGAATYIEVYTAAGMLAPRNILIDAGYKEEASTIRTYLNNAGIKNVEYAVATHYDKDHIGGFLGTTSKPGLLDRTAPNAIIFKRARIRGETVKPPLSNVYNEFLNELKSQIPGSKIKVPTPGAILNLYNGSSWVIDAHYLAVNGATKDVNKPKNDENQLSIVILITVKDRNTNKVLFSYLNAGDFPGKLDLKGKRDRGSFCINPQPYNSANSTGADIKSQIQALTNGQLCVMTASHHGANNSLVDIVGRGSGPNGHGISHVLVSSGYDGNKHPGLEYLRSLKEKRVDWVWVTAVDEHARKNNLSNTDVKTNFKLKADKNRRHHIVVSFKKNGSNITQTIKRVNYRGEQVGNAEDLHCTN